MAVSSTEFCRHCRRAWLQHVERVVHRIPSGLRVGSPPFTGWVGIAYSPSLCNFAERHYLDAATGMTVHGSIR